MNPFETFITLALDGGAASGKSSTARALATKLGWMHVDTGSHYRAITFSLLAAQVTSDAPELSDALKALRFETELDGNQARIKIEGRTFNGDDLRSEAVNTQVSHFAAQPAVRQALFHYQRSQCDIARSLDFAGIVMEGRDIGTVILPDADLRVFLEADETTRAQRRAAEGQKDTIATRDKLDASRKTAPLTCPEGALVINTGELSLDAVVERIIETLKKNQ